MKAYAAVSTLLLVVVAFAGFRQVNQKTKFTEIDVERINIVEKDGKLTMVISNEAILSGSVRVKIARTIWLEKKWWRRTDSNRGPRGYESLALTT